MFDMTGMKFNKLQVIERAVNPRYKHASWVCRCDCGNIVTVVGSNIRNGGTKSCGCSKGEYVSRALSGFPSEFPAEYRSYHAMIARCTNPNSHSYYRYGLVGISVCDRWLLSFENFLEDMGARPTGTTIDRNDFRGNYEPGNCRWATSVEQARNKSNNVVITYNGVVLLAADWASLFGLTVRELKDCLKYSMDFQDFLRKYGYLDVATLVVENQHVHNLKPHGVFQEFDKYLK